MLLQPVPHADAIWSWASHIANLFRECKWNALEKVQLHLWSSLAKQFSSKISEELHFSVFVMSQCFYLRLVCGLPIMTLSQKPLIAFPPKSQMLIIWNDWTSQLITLGVILHKKMKCVNFCMSAMEVLVIITMMNIAWQVLSLYCFSCISHHESCTWLITAISMELLLFTRCLAFNRCQLLLLGVPYSEF